MADKRFKQLKRSKDLPDWLKVLIFVSLVVVVFSVGGYGTYSIIANHINAEADIISKTEYDIFYNLDGGINSDYNKTTYIAGEEIILQPASKTDYIFAGWYKDVECTRSIKKISSNDRGDIALFAKWVPISYEITYNLNGGENHILNPYRYTIENNNIYLAPASKPGYDFKGWFYNAELTDDVTTLQTSAKIPYTVYAKWEMAIYTITFIANGEFVYSEEFSIADMELSCIPNVPEIEGYDGAWEEYEMILDDFTVNAVYMPTEYAINYELNGGNNNWRNPSFYTIENEEDIVLSDPTRAGCIFDGWYSDPYFMNPVTILSIDAKREYTIYAKWKLLEFSITYNLNGGENDASNPSAFTVDDEDIMLAMATKDNADFDGWYMDEALTKKITKIFTVSAKNYSLYAKWGPKTHAVTFMADGEVVRVCRFSEDLELTNLPNVPKKLGYYGAWEDYSVEEFKDYTVEAIYTLKVYYIIYKLDGGENNANNPIEYTILNDNIELADPSKEDYNFLGWYTEYACINSISTIETDSDKNYVLYAKFKIPSFNVYYYNGSTLLFTDEANLRQKYAIKDYYFTETSYVENWRTSGGSPEVYNVGNGIWFTEFADVNLYVNVIDTTTLGLEYEIDHSAAMVTGYIGSSVNVVIPNRTIVNGKYYSVNSISGSAFAGNTHIQSVTLPKGLKIIYGGEVTYAPYSIANSLLNEEDDYYEAWPTECVGAFSGCTSLRQINFAIDGKLQQIGAGAFYGCTSLTNITIPTSVQIVKGSAFYGCTNLTRVHFAEGSACYNIGQSCFQCCTNLTDVLLPTGLKTLNQYVFLYCTSLQSITMPNTVNNIWAYTFGHCTSLQNVVLSTNLKYIGTFALRGCTALTEINLPARLQTINTGAFAYCYKLAQVTMANGSMLQKIGSLAFSNCYSLTSFTIPSNVIAIYSAQTKPAFKGCYRLVEVINYSNLEVTAGSNKNGYVAYYALKVVSASEAPTYVSPIETQDGVLYYILDDKVVAFNYIGNNASVTLRENCTGIKGVFINCYSLVSVVIPNNVVAIDRYTFYGCNNLTEITFMNTTNWQADATSIDSADLQNTQTAATYLKTIYCSAKWKRS